MINYKPGGLVLIDFPFTGGAQVKRRPALVLLDTGDDDVLVARVTSQERQHDFDVEITDWQGAGLLLPSIARLHKLATLEKSLIVKTLGSLQPADYRSAAVVLTKLFVNWQS
jgi:mRNA interferase MazF